MFAISLPVLHQVVPHQPLHQLFTSEDAAALTGGHHGDGGGGGTGGGSNGNDTGISGDATGFKDKSICPKPSAPLIQDEFPTPQYRRSRNGRLDVQLRAEEVPAEINGQRYVSSVYNGKYPGPLLVFCPGDLVRVNVRNALEAANYTGNHPGQTNLHTHGFHVSPRRPSDNIFVVIEPGDNFQYQYKIPRDHPPGAYTYHPHLHGQTNIQTAGGMIGGMWIKGGVDGARIWRNIPTRDLVLTNTALGDGVTIKPGPMGPFVPAGSQWFVNGALNPEIPIQPGELQRWRVYNSSASSFLNLQLEGQPFQVIATDGNYLRRISNQEGLLVGPLSRREILVQGGPAGTAELLNLPFEPFGSVVPGQTLATLDSSGPEVNPRQPPRRLPDQQPDLSDDKINTHHEIVYSQSPPNFFINGEQFNDDPQNVMEEMELNKTSEWTIRNTTNFWHTFHIHINDFQLMEVNGEPVPGIEFNDNVSIQPGGSVTMRYRPEQFTGKFVFHCHVLGHEDNGMMAVVQVKKNLSS